MRLDCPCLLADVCARVVRRLDGIEQMLWQAQRDGFRLGLEIGQHHALRIRPIEMLGGVAPFGFPVQMTRPL